MKRYIKFIAIMMILAGSLLSCEENQVDGVKDCDDDLEDYWNDAKDYGNDVITHGFYVVDFEKEECGHLLLVDLASLGWLYGFGNFMWADDLPQIFRIDELPVTVAYRIIGQCDDGLEIINVLKIKKQ